MPIPCVVPVLGSACYAVGSAVSSVAGSAFQAVVDAFAKGLADVIKALMTFWTHGPDPDVSSSSGVITSLTDLTRPLVAFAAVLGLIVGGARLAWTARADQTQSILRGLLLMTVVTGAGATIIEALLTGFDGTAVGLRLAALGSLPGTGGGLVFLLAFFGMVASLVQVGIMLVRGAILAVLVGILPVAAASAITETGYEWFKKLAGWIGSFTVYKLVAAVVYAAAFTIIGDATDLAGVVSGFSLMIVSILALPALLRLLPPAAGAIGGGGGGALAGLASAGATGAVLLAGRGGGSAAPAATTSPGLEQQSPSGANGTAGAGGANAAVPAGGTTAAGGGASSAGGGASGAGGASG